MRGFCHCHRRFIPSKQRGGLPLTTTSFYSFLGGEPNIEIVVTIIISSNPYPHLFYCTCIVGKWYYDFFQPALHLIGNAIWRVRMSEMRTIPNYSPRRANLPFSCAVNLGESSKLPSISCWGRPAQPQENCGGLYHTERPCPLRQAGVLGTGEVHPPAGFVVDLVYLREDSAFLFS